MNRVVKIPINLARSITPDGDQTDYEELSGEDSVSSISEDSEEEEEEEENYSHDAGWTEDEELHAGDEGHRDPSSPYHNPKEEREGSSTKKERTPKIHNNSKISSQRGQRSVEFDKRKGVQVDFDNKRKGKKNPLRKTKEVN